MPQYKNLDEFLSNSLVMPLFPIALMNKSILSCLVWWIGPCEPNKSEWPSDWSWKFFLLWNCHGNIQHNGNPFSQSWSTLLSFFLMHLVLSTFRNFLIFNFFAPFQYCQSMHSTNDYHPLVHFYSLVTNFPAFLNGKESDTRHWWNRHLGLHSSV